MKIHLVYSHSAVVRPGLNRIGAPAQPTCKSEVRVLYEIQDEYRRRITTPCGGYQGGPYLESAPENAMKQRLQTLVGDDYEVCSRPVPNGREAWFEAVRSFPCMVNFGETERK